jgi:SET domain-containing protein
MELSEKTGTLQHGLYATGSIDKDTCLGITHVKDDRFEDGLIRTPLGGFFNHSDSPNCKLVESDGIIKLHTIKDIKWGEELTCTYTLYDPTT